ncbi:MAG: PRC-barrel domain-containing protein [Methanomicrobiaceae archaeon]|nr:PRC-barrel domain-containing protein [Methanomicrobiaceae archaeon]
MRGTPVAEEREERVITPRVMAANDLIGFGVQNPQGEDLGKIDDLMIDVHEGCIAYAVLSFGGILGMGGKYFAIPWDALSLRSDEDNMTLNVPKERLDNAPGYDKDNPPRAADREWLRGVYSHYGYEPYWERRRY